MCINRNRTEERFFMKQIPYFYELTKTHGLTRIEAIIYSAMIDGGNGHYSNKHLARISSACVPSISRCIKNLEQKGLIAVDKRLRNRYITINHDLLNSNKTHGELKSGVRV